MHGVVITAKARRTLRRLPARDRDSLIAKVETFAAAPTASHGFAKRLTGRPETRIRAGNYRALVAVDHEVKTVTILEVWDRRDAY